MVCRTQARQRVGVAPAEELIARAAVPLAQPGTKGAAWPGADWRRSTGAVRHRGHGGERRAFREDRVGAEASAYPKLQVVVLMECTSRAVVGAVLGSCRTGERTLAGDLAAAVEHDMLVLAASIPHRVPPGSSA
jgi:hypothetical protein